MEASKPNDTGQEKSKRNPPWNRDELILALDLYLTNRKSPPGHNSREVDALSAFLNVMSRALGNFTGDKYRNNNGVYMKMMNFRRFDDEYTQTGKKGLSRGNRDEELVWNEFSRSPEYLAKVCTAIRAAVDTHREDSILVGIDDMDVFDAPEGRVLTRLHRVRERSQRLVRLAKERELKTTGQLGCQACGFVFSQRYGQIGEGIIEVHHTKPIHTLTEDSKTRIEDLALLCANCHRIVHSSRKWLSVEEVTAMVRT